VFRSSPNPVLVYSLFLIASIGLTGFLSWLLVWDATGDGTSANDGGLQLLGPYTRYRRVALLLMPCFALCSRVLDGRAPRWWLAPLNLALAATFVHGLAWHHIPSGMLLSMPFYAALVLFGMLAWLIFREKRWQRIKQTA
jgi:hypothetical protein